MDQGNKSQLEQAQDAIQSGRFLVAETILADINGREDERCVESLILQSQAQEAQSKNYEAANTLLLAAELAQPAAYKAQVLAKAADLALTDSRANFDAVENAIKCLEDSVALDPGASNAMSRKNLCAAHFSQGDYVAVVKHAAALERFPQFAVQAKLWAAHACFILGREKLGVDFLASLEGIADQIQEDETYWLLDLEIKYRRLIEAQSVIDNVDSRLANKIAKSVYQASLHHEKRDYESVVSILTGGILESGDGSLDTKYRGYFLRGRSLDHLGTHDAAHQSFEAMNQVGQKLYAGPLSADIRGAFERVDLSKLPDYPPQDSQPYSPSFMIGFPRSGTTLLETILNAQDRIITLGEVGSMLPVIREMSRIGKPYPFNLTALGEDDVNRLRSVYFNHNADYLALETDTDIVIDKMPLNLMHVPLILTLFPRAKLIMSLRHPADVCLSCFQQGFLLNPEMAHFLTMEGCFQRYRDLMSFYEGYCSQLELKIHSVRYEDLVEDMQSVTGQVLRFLGLQCGTVNEDFHALSTERFVMTPSSDQVSRPIYGSSRERWKNYAEHVSPYLPIVDEFIKKYGYAL